MSGAFSFISDGVNYRGSNSFIKALVSDGFIRFFDQLFTNLDFYPYCLRGVRGDDCCFSFGRTAKA